MRLVVARMLMAFVALALLGGLVATAYAGTFSRYWADDYCYAAVFHQDGLVSGTLHWYQTSGNRFSAFIAVGLSELLGRASVAFLPSLLLIGWLVAAYFFLQSALRPMGFSTDRLGVITAALGWVNFAAYTSPDRLQTLYWRMGLLHYSLPLVLLLIQAGIIVRAIQSSSLQLSWPSVTLFSLLALFSAGLSETAAALQTTLYLMALGWLGLRKMRLKSRPMVMLLGGLGGSLLSMLIMALSPANKWRQALLPPPPSLWIWAETLVRHTLAFIIGTLKSLPLPFLVWFTLCAVLGWLLSGEQVEPRITHWVMLFGSMAVVGTAAAIAPSVYAGLQYPTSRALMTACFPLLSGLGLAAAAWGIWLKGRVSSFTRRWANIVALGLLLLVGVYALHAMQLPLSEAQVLAVKAKRWDARHAQILSQRAQGFSTIRVREIDVVSTLEDLSPQPDHWVNRCAAAYYRVEQIIAER